MEGIPSNTLLMQNCEDTSDEMQSGRKYVGVTVYKTSLP